MELDKKNITLQKSICAKYSSKFNPINRYLFLGVATNLEFEPINGLRHPEHGTMNGWYIWSGEWSDANNFFNPIHVEHLVIKRPKILKYLSLDVGFRFQMDRKGYEDVWYDEKLKNI